MIELLKYFRILFLSPKLSRDRLRQFTEAHIQALTNNNPGGIFTTILTDVTNAYTAYFGDLASRSVTEGVKQGKTQARDESREKLQKNISDNEALVKYTYRNTPSVYQEFYPFGVDEYHQADDAKYVTITQRFKTVLAAHSADFPASFVTEYNTLQGTFISNYNAQLAAIQDIYTEISDIAATKGALAKQLTINLLTIALEFVGDETKADVYFRQDILDAAFKESDRKVSSDINPGETQNAFDNVSNPDIQISIKNESENPLVVGFASAVNIAPTQLTVQPGNEETLNASELGWTTENKFFNISNGNIAAGRYTVTKV